MVLLDNAPTGLLPGKDCTALVSSDNFGLGKIAAAGLSAHIPDGAKVGVLGFADDFFVTNEREIAFTKWLQVNRPDILGGKRTVYEASGLSSQRAGVMARQLAKELHARRRCA